MRVKHPLKHLPPTESSKNINIKKEMYTPKLPKETIEQKK